MWTLSPKDFKNNERESLTGNGNVGLVRRKVFRELGKFEIAVRVKSIADEVTLAQEQLEQDGQFKATNKTEGKERVLKSIALRRGQPKFRAELLTSYEGCCAVTGKSIGDVLEAAHIIPFDGESTNHVQNGLLLRSDIHALFDIGLLAVDPSTMNIHCNEQIRGEELYRDLHGKKLRTPANVKQHPDCKALKEHYDNRK